MLGLWRQFLCFLSSKVPLELNKSWTQNVATRLTTKASWIMKLIKLEGQQLKLVRKHLTVKLKSRQPKLARIIYQLS